MEVVLLRVPVVDVVVVVVVMKHHVYSSLGRKGFIELTLPYHCSPPKEVRAGTQVGQEPGGRN